MLSKNQFFSEEGWHEDKRLCINFREAKLTDKVVTEEDWSAGETCKTGLIREPAAKAWKQKDYAREPPIKRGKSPD